MTGHLCRPRADVTVAVATADRPSQLARCLAAILAGSTLPAELIVVDQSANGRTAGAGACVEPDPFVRVTYLRQPRLGLSASRNLAIAHATHPIIVFTDDDCVPDRGWLQAIVNGFATASSPDAVTGRILPLGAERLGLHAMSTLDYGRRTVHRGLSLPWRAGSGANTAVSRQWLDRLGGFDETLGVGSPGQSAEDVDLMYRLLRGGATIQYEPDAVVFHERQDAARRLVTSAAYGYGMAVFCTSWMRRRSLFAVWMFLLWGLDRARAVLSACVRGRWWRIREEIATVGGAVRGITRGLTPRAEARRAQGATA